MMFKSPDSFHGIMFLHVWNNKKTCYVYCQFISNNLLHKCNLHITFNQSHFAEIVLKLRCKVFVYCLIVVGIHKGIKQAI